MFRTTSPGCKVSRCCPAASWLRVPRTEANPFFSQSRNGLANPRGAPASKSFLACVRLRASRAGCHCWLAQQCILLVTLAARTFHGWPHRRYKAEFVIRLPQGNQHRRARYWFKRHTLLGGASSGTRVCADHSQILFAPRRNGGRIDTTTQSATGFLGHCALRPRNDGSIGRYNAQCGGRTSSGQV